MRSTFEVIKFTKSMSSENNRRGYLSSDESKHKGRSCCIRVLPSFVACDAFAPNPFFWDQKRSTPETEHPFWDNQWENFVMSPSSRPRFMRGSMSDRSGCAKKSIRGKGVVRLLVRFSVPQSLLFRLFRAPHTPPTGHFSAVLASHILFHVSPSASFWGNWSRWF